MRDDLLVYSILNLGTFIKLFGKQSIGHQIYISKKMITNWSIKI